MRKVREVEVSGAANQEGGLEQAEQKSGVEMPAPAVSWEEGMAKKGRSEREAGA